MGDQSASRNPDTYRYRAEAPIFTGLDATSFTYAFELEFAPAAQRRNDDDDAAIDYDCRSAFRLRKINGAISGFKGSRQADEEKAYKRLIEPVRSFLEDVTMGPAGSNGRPLLFAAAHEEPDDASRRVWILRPPSWSYEFEDIETELATNGPAREFRIRDSFCVFESGRIFYLLTLTQPTPTSRNAAEAERQRRAIAIHSAIDEYLVLQLQQLAMQDRACAGRADYLAFAGGAVPPSNGLSLIDFAEARLNAVVSSETGGFKQIIQRFGLLPDQHPLTGTALVRQPLSRRHLRKLCIGIESDSMLAIAERAQARFDGAAEPPPSRLPWRRKRRPAVDRAWLAQWRGRSMDPPPHDEPDNDFDRSLLTFAGLAQGVPDFPNQDESEVHDSTRPAARSVESALFVHPRFVMEVAKSWRSYSQARPEIGTCPYLLLMFAVATHDELIVAEMEGQLDRMVYAGTSADGDVDGGAPDTDYRVTPMRAVLNVLRKVSHWGGSGNAILEANLRQRFELFRWASIQRAGNIFRYPKERDALAAIQSAMGTDARFDRAHSLVDRMESLTEDVSSLKAAYAAEHTSGLLFALAIIGLIGLPKNVYELFEPIWTSTDPLAKRIVYPIAVLGIAGLILWSLRRVLRRRRPNHDRRPSKSA